MGGYRRCLDLNETIEPEPEGPPTPLALLRGWKGSLFTAPWEPHRATARGDVVGEVFGDYPTLELLDVVVALPPKAERGQSGKFHYKFRVLEGECRGEGEGWVPEWHLPKAALKTLPVPTKMCLSGQGWGLTQDRDTPQELARRMPQPLPPLENIEPEG